MLVFLVFFVVVWCSKTKHLRVSIGFPSNIFAGVLKIFAGVLKIFAGVSNIFATVLKIFAGVVKIFAGVLKIFTGIPEMRRNLNGTSGREARIFIQISGASYLG